MQEHPPTGGSPTFGRTTDPLAAPEPVRTERTLESSLRPIKIWLAVLTVAVALMFLGACGLGTVFFAGVSMWADSPYPSVSDEQLDDVRIEIEEAYGPSLETVEVRVVAMEWGYYDPTPFSWLDDGGEESIYVEYRIEGVDVWVADVLEGPWGPDVASSGMLPTRGTLASRMTDEQFQAILAAYEQEVRAPVGSVKRYTDRSSMMMYESPVPDEVFVAGEEYPSKQVWWVLEGRRIEGDSVDMDQMYAGPRRAHIFHEDPETGAFAYLGSEPADTYW